MIWVILHRLFSGWIKRQESYSFYKTRIYRGGIPLPYIIKIEHEWNKNKKGYIDHFTEKKEDALFHDTLEFMDENFYISLEDGNGSISVERLFINHSENCKKKSMKSCFFLFLYCFNLSSNEAFASCSSNSLDNSINFVIHVFL